MDILLNLFETLLNLKIRDNRVVGDLSLGVMCGSQIEISLIKQFSIRSSANLGLSTFGVRS